MNESDFQLYDKIPLSIKQIIHKNFWTLIDWEQQNFT